MCPQILTYHRQRICKGRVCFVVPGCLPEYNLRTSCHPLVNQQRNEREKGQECRGGSSYRSLRPLPLRLESEMSPHLLEAHLQLPAHHEPGEDLLWIGLKGGTEESLGFERPLRIAHQDPAQGYGK